MSRLGFCLSGMVLVLAPSAVRTDGAEDVFQHLVWSTAHRVPPETTSEESGYFSIVEGHDGRIYIGTAKYGDNAYLVEPSIKSAGIPKFSRRKQLARLLTHPGNEHFAKNAVTFQSLRRASVNPVA